MEKHKPYRCNACGKRYKNLNGLKYHKNHSTACEDGKPLDSMETSSNAKPSSPLPASKTQKPTQGGLGTASTFGVGMGVPVNMNNGYPATGGLPGIDEEMIL